MLKKESHPIRGHRLATPTERHPHGIDPGGVAYLGGARLVGSTAEGDGRQGCGGGLAKAGVSVRVAGSEAEGACAPTSS